MALHINNPGGASLGVARGAITIDMSDLNQVRVLARAVGQEVAASMRRIDAEAKRAQSGITKFSNGIRDLRGEIIAIGATGAILSGLGLKTAASLQEARIQLTGMLASETKAVALMDELRKRAQAAGVPFADMLGAARQFLPTLEGDTRQLDKFLQLARRVATLRPSEGIGGAAFAINEALTTGGTDLISLAERFNISKARFRDALKETGGDFASALDLVLTRMGITDETAEKMGQTFRASLTAAKDAAMQLLGAGFAPLLDSLTALLQKTTDWLTQIESSAPGFATFAAGIASIAAVGAPALLILNQLIIAAKTLRALQIGAAIAAAAPILGPLGLGVAAVGVGVTAGIGLGNMIRRSRGQKELTPGEVGSALKQDINEMQLAIANFGMWVRLKFAEIVQGFANAIATAIDALGSFATALGNLLPEGMGKGAVGKQGAFLTESAAMIREMGRAFVDVAQRNNQVISARLNPSLAPPMGADIESRYRAQPRMQRAGPDVWTAEQQAAMVEWAQNITEIERDAGNARLDATRQYEQQRTEAIAQYELGIARDAEDFARGRARAQAKFNQDIADIQTDAAQREADWWADLQESIADIQADGAERIADIEDDYRRQRERAERDHRDRLFSAAARLDAHAVADEQRRFSRQQQDADSDHSERLNTEAENIAERIAQEQEGHAERLEDARRADAERLADMQADFVQAQALEDEERAIRLARQAEDQQRQLDSMATAHANQLAAINASEAAQKASADEAHAAALTALGLYNADYMTAQSKLQGDSLRMWREYWQDWYKSQFEALKQAGLLLGPKTQAESALVWNPPTFGGSAAGMVGSGRSGASATINVYATPGMDVEGVANVVDGKLRTIFQELRR